MFPFSFRQLLLAAILLPALWACEKETISPTLEQEQTTLAIQLEQTDDPPIAALRPRPYPDCPPIQNYEPDSWLGYLDWLYGEIRSYDEPDDQGALEQQLNCPPTSIPLGCDPECGPLSIELSANGGDPIFDLTCESIEPYYADGIITVAEQQAMIANIQQAALEQAPICHATGTPMTPVQYRVWYDILLPSSNDSCIGVFVEVTYLSECRLTPLGPG